MAELGPESCAATAKRRAAAQLVSDEKARPVLRCSLKGSVTSRNSQIFLDVIEPDPPCSLSNPGDWGQMGPQT